MPSKGSVSPSTNTRNTQREPGIRSWPKAKPARVPMTRRSGTTPSTMRTLDTSSRPMSAETKARAKLPHCGSSGQAMPGG